MALGSVLRAAVSAGLLGTALGLAVRNETVENVEVGTLGASLNKLDWSDVASLQPAQFNGKQYGCKCYPGESCWPSAQSWSKLNQTVSGKLVVHIPPGASCHNSFEGPLGTVNTYNEAACQDAQANWANETWT